MFKWFWTIILVGCPWNTSCSRMNHTDTSFLMLFSNSLNYSCCWKPINNNHLGWVDETWYPMNHQIKHHQVFIWDQTLAVAFLLFHLRRKGRNLGFVLHHGLQTPQNRWKHLAYSLMLSSVSQCLTYYIMFQVKCDVRFIII